MTEFKDKLFLVTGASSGIGQACTSLLLERGARVITVARRKLVLEEYRNRSLYYNNIEVEVFDLVTEIGSISEWLTSISRKHGMLSGLVHAAGILDISPLSSVSLEEQKRLFDINYFAAIALARGFANKLVHSTESSMVFVSSIAAATAVPALFSYGASKAALDAAARHLACELKRFGIRINTVRPGTTMTDMVRSQNGVYDQEYFETIKKKTIGSRIGDPEDIAKAIVFLLSWEAAWITGAIITVDGGESLQ